MFKKLLALLLTLVLCLSMGTVGLAAEEDTTDETADATSGQCGDNAYWSYDVSTGTLTISGDGNMYGYGVLSATPWYTYCDAITSVVIEDGVTSIGDYAFYGCTSLTSVTIPNSVTSIGSEAFHRCTSLTSITIPDSVTSIALVAFYDCTGLTSVTIPDSVTFIGDGAFLGCTSLTEITFKGDAPDIDTSAFLGVTATAYYPADNDTWTEDVMQDYGGTITWVAYDCDTGDHIWDDGEITTKAADYESTGIKTYTCTVCGETKTEEYTFINGTVTSNVRTAILWAAENGISKGYTSGADNGTFGVGRTVTREEMVIFLYRLAKYTGEDVSASAAITFSDTDEIKTNTGRTAISWAVAEGITNGYSDGSNTFGPQDECTREQICIFLWRLAGKPSVTDAELAAVSEFSDADEISNNTAKKAIAWAYSEGIIKGYTGSNEFGPTDSCLREQFAIMMYRYAN